MTPQSKKITCYIYIIQFKNLASHRVITGSVALTTRAAVRVGRVEDGEEGLQQLRRACPQALQQEVGPALQ